MDEEEDIVEKTKTIEQIIMDEEDKVEKTKLDKKTHKSRCRMKKLLNYIQELLEFYFGDANLNHDRFLRKEIEEKSDGYIDLSAMLKFNQLKQLTSDTTMLAKAVDNSPILELSEDRTKVRRKAKLRELENTDARTVYVEEFPNNVDHDWLKTVFSTCGTVEYISLPKYKHNNQVKGFAFIEFSSPSEAEKACQMLDTVPTWKSKNKKRLSSGGTNLERTNEDGTVKQKARKRRSTSVSEDTTPTKQKIIKKRRSISESSDGTPTKINKKKGNNCCCIEEGSVKYETNDIQKLSKTVADDLSTDVSLSTSNKKKRRRDTGISSESENELTPVKSGKSSMKVQQNVVGSSTPIQKSAIGSPSLVPKSAISSSVTSQPTSNSRKRKSSEEKIISNKAKTLQTPKTNKDEIDDTETVDPKHITISVCEKISKCDSDSTDDPVKDNLKKKTSTDETGGLTSDCQRDKSDKPKRKASTTDKKHEIIEKKIKLERSKQEEQETSISGNTEEREISFSKSSEEQACKKEQKTSISKNTVEQEAPVSENIKEQETPIIKNTEEQETSIIKNTEEQGKKIKDTKNVLAEGNESENNKTEGENVIKKKNRQHKKKGDGASNEISVPPLHVIPKSEWLTLKKKYKRLQRVEMSKLKKTLKVLKYEEVRRVELKERIIGTLIAKGKIKEINESTSIQHDEEKAKVNLEEEKENCDKLMKTNTECVEDQGVDVKSKVLKTSSGTMVVLKTSSEKLTKKDIRNSLSPFGQVAYVDYTDGLYQGYVRFSTSEDLEKVLNSSEMESWGFELTKLSNTEENEYFQKAEEDRLKKYDKDRKKKKKRRGVDKISRDVENVSNHVHFT